MSPTTLPETATDRRAPVEVGDHHIDVGGRVAEFRPEELQSLLRVYLVLVRKMRSQRRVAEIQLRRADIETLAAHIGVTEAVVVARLAGLMGATRSQRTAMLAVFASGALLIGLAGSAKAEPPTLSLVPSVDAESAATAAGAEHHDDAGASPVDNVSPAVWGLLAGTDDELSTARPSMPSMATRPPMIFPFGGERPRNTTPVKHSHSIAVTPSPAAPHVVSTAEEGSPNDSAVDDSSAIAVVDGVEVAVGLAPTPPPGVLPVEAPDIASSVPAVEAPDIASSAPAVEVEVEVAPMVPVSDDVVPSDDIPGDDIDVAVVDGVEVAVGTAPIVPVLPTPTDIALPEQPTDASAIEGQASVAALVDGVEVAVGLAPVPPVLP